ncbi:MAG TPA: flagellar protein FlgN [Chroococcales cyanobacterium]
MEELLKRLEEVLKAEGNAYASFCNRLPLKIGLIKRNQATQLERILAQEEPQLQSLLENERERAKVIQAIAQQLNLDSPTWQDLLPCLAPEQRARLNPLIERLRLFSQKLKEGNWLYSQLLQAAIGYVDYSIGVVASAFSTCETSYGEPESRETPSLILDWIA